MSNYTWIATSDGNFNVATNWQDENGAAGVPGVDDTIILAGSARCTVNADVTVKNVYTEGYTGRLYPGANRTLTVANGEFILAADAQGAGTGNIKILNSTLRIKSGGSIQRLTVQDSSIILETNITITPVTFVGSSVISGAFQLSVANIDIDEDAEIEVRTTAVLRTAKTGGTISGGRFFGEGSVVLYYNVASNITTFSGTKFDCDVFLQQSSFIFTGGTEIKRLGNLTNTNIVVAVDNAKIDNWDITLASNRTFTLALDGPLELTGNIATTGTASAINFTQGTDGEIVLTGGADQTIQSPFESVKIVLDKPSGEVDFLGVDCLLESKTARDPGDDDPRTVSQADLVFSTDAEITLSGSVYVASVDNSGSIIVPVSMVLDTYSYIGQEDSTISGAGTLRVHDGDYDSDGTDSVVIEYWSDSQIQPPMTPTGLEGNAMSDAAIRLSWNSVANTASNLERSTDRVVWELVYHGAGSTFTDTGLVSSTDYYYRICSSNQAGTSLWSQSIKVSTYSPAPSAPSTFYEVASTATTIVLAWYGVSGATKYTLERTLQTQSDWTVIYSGSAMMFTDSNLTPLTNYLYRVKAENEWTQSSWSEVLSLGTGPDSLSAPSNVSVVPYSGGLRVSWNHVENATKYQIQRSLHGIDEWAVIYTGTSLNHTDLSVLPSTAYDYQVQAQNSYLSSPWSQSVTETSSPGTPDTPTGLRATPQSTESILVLWELAPDVTTYYLQYSLNGLNEWNGAYWGSTTPFLFTRCEPRTTYYFRLRGINSTGDSPWSEVVTATTFSETTNMIAHREIHSFRFSILTNIWPEKFLRKRTMLETHYHLTNQKTAFENGSTVFLAQIKFLKDSTPVLPEDITSIRYSVYRLDDYDPMKKTPVEGHVNVPVAIASVVLETFRLDGLWNLDEVGYNFQHEPNISEHPIFPTPGRNYRVEYRIGVSGQANELILRYRINVI